MKKKVKDLTNNELTWLYERDFLTLFNCGKKLERTLIPVWKIKFAFIEPFTSPRYETTVDIEQVDIIYEHSIVNFEGWICIKDKLLKRKLIVRGLGVADSISHGYIVVAKHSEEELSCFINMITAGKALKIESVKETVKDISENLSEIQKIGWEDMMGEFFKILSMYTESVQNMAHSMELILNILQERIKLLEQNSQKDAEQFLENIYDLQLKGADIFKQSNNLLMQVMAMYSKLSEIVVQENKITA